MSEHKVFGVGFQKTATKSLARALAILGYRVTGPNFIFHPNIEQEVYGLAFKMAERYDAFQDNPWPLLYKALDQRYPGSKFILTQRPAQEWIQSVVRHFGNKETAMRRWIYGVGSPRGHEDVYLERYLQHNSEVEQYFSDRPNDLLVLDITSGEGWNKLCSFLNKSVPDVPFPHSNKAEHREARQDGLPDRTLLRELMRRRHQGAGR